MPDADEVDVFIKMEDSSDEDLYFVAEGPAHDNLAWDGSTPSGHNTRIVWSEEDDMFANLFHAWDGLPLETDDSDETVISVLMKLDHVIAPFEKAIRYSDSGFSEYRERHKRAMEAGLAKAPTWPPLRTGLPPRWLDEEWNKRYHYLISQRCKLIDMRLAALTPDLASHKITLANSGTRTKPTIGVERATSNAKRYKKGPPTLY